MKKVLITGSSGFIGSHLKKALEKEAVEVVEFSLEKGQQITNLRDFERLPKVELVFHLAAVSGYKDSKDNPNLAYDVNFNGVVNVLDYCRKVGAKMVFPSTYVYALPYKKIKKETDEVGPMTHYAFTKYLGERLCQFYARVLQVDSLIIRTSNVYGSGQDYKYIVPIIVDHLVNQKPLTLTKPKVERSYIYIDDLVKAYIALAKAKTQSGEVFNVAPDEATSLAELVNLAEEIAGKKLKLNYTGESRPNDVDFNWFNTTKVKQKIGWKPEVDLKEGLKRYLQAVKS